MGQLIIGENDLLTKFPELAKEWHPTKNGSLKPSEVAAFSNKSRWWIYPYDDPITGKHFDFEWDATPNNRANGVGCPFLSNKKVWTGFNDLQTRNPDLAKEWHPYKNGDLMPSDVLPSCGKRVWWYLPYDDIKTGKHFDFEWEATINNRSKGSKCPYISGRCAWKGYNDMWTTNPAVASLLKNPDDGYIKMYNTDAELEFVCPCCGKVIMKKPRRVLNENGVFICPQCGDGFSFPEKLLYNVLSQVGEDFIYQLSCRTFKWCEQYRYDFYLKNKNRIIEINGRQHYEDTSRTNVKDVRENDKAKRDLALRHGIDTIYVDARNSSSEWLMNSIFEALGNIIDLDNVNWNDCIKNASKSYMISICNEWDENVSLIYDIAERYGISEDSVKNYLKAGAEIGLCAFNAAGYMERVRNDGTSRRWKHKVLCKETGEIFPSVRSAALHYDISEDKLHRECSKNSNYDFDGYHFSYYEGDSLIAS